MNGRPVGKEQKGVLIGTENGIVKVRHARRRMAGF